MNTDRNKRENEDFVWKDIISIHHWATQDK